MKRLKEFWEYLNDEIFYPIKINIRVFYESLSRAIAFGRFVWDKYDFESDSMFAIMAFKLQRVKKCMDEGYGVYPKPVKQAMKEAIKICNRLYENQYEEPYRKAHDKKWGRMNLKRLLDEQGFIDWTCGRKGVKTETDKREEGIDTLRDAGLAWRDRMRDFDRLNKILKKYQNAWWD